MNKKRKILIGLITFFSLSSLTAFFTLFGGLYLTTNVTIVRAIKTDENGKKTPITEEYNIKIGSGIFDNFNININDQALKDENNNELSGALKYNGSLFDINYDGYWDVGLSDNFNINSKIKDWSKNNDLETNNSLSWKNQINNIKKKINDSRILTIFSIVVLPISMISLLITTLIFIRNKQKKD